jgi:hypothetical protein
MFEYKIRVEPVKRSTGWFLQVLDAGGHMSVMRDQVMLTNGILGSPGLDAIQRYDTREELRCGVREYNDRNRGMVRLSGGLH